VKQNHIARRACILDDLQRDSTVVFSALDETGGTLVGIAIGMQVKNIRMIQKQLTACSSRVNALAASPHFCGGQRKQLLHRHREEFLLRHGGLALEEHPHQAFLLATVTEPLLIAVKQRGLRTALQRNFIGPTTRGTKVVQQNDFIWTYRQSAITLSKSSLRSHIDSVRECLYSCGRARGASGRRAVRR